MQLALLETNFSQDFMTQSEEGRLLVSSVLIIIIDNMLGVLSLTFGIL